MKKVLALQTLATGNTTISFDSTSSVGCVADEAFDSNCSVDCQLTAAGM